VAGRGESGTLNAELRADGEKQVQRTGTEQHIGSPRRQRWRHHTASPHRREDADRRPVDDGDADRDADAGHRAAASDGHRKGDREERHDQRHEGKRQLASCGHLQAENIQTASMLARQKMTEKMIELQKDMDKGKFPDDQINDQGNFEAPFDRFRFEFAVRKVEIPVVENPSDQNGQATGEGPATSTGKEPGAANQAPEQAQANLAKLVTKKISESVREITTKVLWQEMEEDQSIVVTTHISKLQ